MPNNETESPSNRISGDEIKSLMADHVLSDLLREGQAERRDCPLRQNTCRLKF